MSRSTRVNELAGIVVVVGSCIRVRARMVLSREFAGIVVLERRIDIGCAFLGRSNARLWREKDGWNFLCIRAYCFHLLFFTD